MLITILIPYSILIRNSGSDSSLDCTQGEHSLPPANAKCTRPLELWLPQLKVIRDSNPDFRFDSNLGVSQIAPKM